MSRDNVVPLVPGQSRDTGTGQPPPFRGLSRCPLSRKPRGGVWIVIGIGAATICTPAQPTPRTEVTPLREIDGRHLRRSIAGRQVLTRRLQRALLAVHRFARGRATTPDDRRWAACTIDALNQLLGVADTRPKGPHA